MELVRLRLQGSLIIRIMCQINEVYLIHTYFFKIKFNEVLLLYTPIISLVDLPITIFKALLPSSILVKCYSKEVPNYPLLRSCVIFLEETFLPCEIVSPTPNPQA